MEKKSYLIIIVGIVIAFAFYWFLLREPVSNQRERTNAVTESLERTGAEQRNAQEHIERIGRGIDESIGRVDDVAEGISGASEGITDVQERNRECARIAADSERRIAESQRIIQSIRERARQN